MGKTPKKAAPGGDERNLYKRKRKATTAPSNPSESSLHKRQRESEISNRIKVGTLVKTNTRGRRKNFACKVRTPVKFKVNRVTRQAGKSPGSPKEKKLTISEKSEESISADMQPESEEAEVKLNPSVQKEDTETEVSKDIQESNKEHVDGASSESVSISKVQEDTVNEEAVAEEENTVCQEKEKNSNESKEIEEQEEQEEIDLNLSYETEDNVPKVQAEETDDKNSKEETKEESSATVPAAKNGVPEKEELQNESQTDTESYSADGLEFTTSEMSEISESASQHDAPKKKEKSEVNSGKDASFISYDPSITLKDVQIKLNDCLKGNSKSSGTSNSGGVGSLSQPSKGGMSYGKTMRSISGRRSLSRMRHVTIHEQRYSPNDSMFVNTSTASLGSEDSMDFKILRYNTGSSDTVSATNGSPTEGKRKHEMNDWNFTKKQKTESENSLLNSSVGLLKGLRRPIQVSTPISELKFHSGKLDLEEETKQANEDTKKWCVIM